MSSFCWKFRRGSHIELIWVTLQFVIIERKIELNWRESQTSVKTNPFGAALETWKGLSCRTSNLKNTVLYGMSVIWLKKKNPLSTGESQLEILKEICFIVLPRGMSILHLAEWDIPRPGLMTHSSLCTSFSIERKITQLRSQNIPFLTLWGNWTSYHLISRFTQLSSGI